MIGVFNIKFLEQIGCHCADVVTGSAGGGNGISQIFQIILGKFKIAGFTDNFFNGRKKFVRIDIYVPQLRNAVNLIIEVIDLFLADFRLNAQTGQA